MTNNDTDRIPTSVPGTHHANALAFIVDSLADGEVEGTGDLRFMDTESLMEFAERYNFTLDTFFTALRRFEAAYLTEERVMRDR